MEYLCMDCVGFNVKKMMYNECDYQLSNKYAAQSECGVKARFQ